MDLSDCSTSLPRWPVWIYGTTFNCSNNHPKLSHTRQSLSHLTGLNSGAVDTGSWVESKKLILN